MTRPPPRAVPIAPEDSPERAALLRYLFDGHAYAAMQGATLRASPALAARYLIATGASSLPCRGADGGQDDPGR